MLTRFGRAFGLGILVIVAALAWLGCADQGRNPVTAEAGNQTEIASLPTDESVPVNISREFELNGLPVEQIQGNALALKKYIALGNQIDQINGHNAVKFKIPKNIWDKKVAYTKYCAYDTKPAWWNFYNDGHGDVTKWDLQYDKNDGTPNALLIPKSWLLGLKMFFRISPNPGWFQIIIDYN